MTIRDSLSAPKGCVVAPSRGGSDRCLAELTRVDCTRGDVLAKALTMSKLNDLMARGTELLGSDYAILCGAMSWVSERHLVSAISNAGGRSEEHTSELKSLMRTSYAVFCLNNKTQKQYQHKTATTEDDTTRTTKPLH